MALIVILLAAPIAFSKQWSPLAVQGAAAAPLDCTNPHCYGTAWWWGGNIGAETTQIIRQISYDPQAQHYINNEMWVADHGNSQCIEIRCWVEVGYTSGYLSDVNASYARAYFFADVRPNSPYYEHFLGTVSVIDHNSFVDFRIERDPNNASTWRVTIFAPSVSILAYSTSNNMSPDLIEIGQELYGYPIRTSAPKSFFSYNSWIDSSHTLHYQTSNGEVYQDFPPIKAAWRTPPTASPYGGEFDVECCIFVHP